MSRLSATVHVVDDEGHRFVFGPDDDVPEWAARKMGPHCFEDGDHPYPAAAGSGSVPPKAGPGSGTDAWAAYAAGLGLEVPDGVKREEIIQALTDAGHPVDPA